MTANNKKQNLISRKLPRTSEGDSRLRQILKFLRSRAYLGSNVKCDMFEEYLDVVMVIQNSKNVLWPDAINIATRNVEGRILSRMLFISMTEKFEKYLLKLIFHVCTENPKLLKCDDKITVNEVLRFSTMEAFIAYRADLRINEFKSASPVETILKDSILRNLISMTDEQMNNLVLIFQIAALYLYRNGLVDNEFKRQSGSLVNLHSEFVLSISELLDKLYILVRIIDLIDSQAVQLYKIS